MSVLSTAGPAPASTALRIAAFVVSSKTARGVLDPLKALASASSSAERVPEPDSRSTSAVDANSANYIAAMNPTKALHPDWGSRTDFYGIPYIVVPETQPKVPVVCIRFSM